VASRAANAELCQKLYRGYTDGAEHDGGALTAATQAYNELVHDENRLTADSERSNQKRLSDALDDASFTSLWTRSDPATRAHLQLVQAPGAAAFLQAPPCENTGTALPHSLAQVAVQRRLRVQLAETEDFCPACGEVMDVFGDHALTCSCKGDRTKRHNALRNQCFFDALAAGFPAAELERPGLLPPRPADEGPPSQETDGLEVNDSGRRPADVYLPRWRNGVAAAWDLAVTSGLRADLLADSAANPGTALERYEEAKRQHGDTQRRCQAEGLTFLPLVVEAHGGGWGPEARRAFAVLAKRVADTTGETAATVAAQQAQRLSVLLQRENSRAVLRRLQGRREGAQGAPVARLAAAIAAAAQDAA
jgi:hypothetical protein